MAFTSIQNYIRKLRGFKNSIEQAQEAGLKSMQGYIEGEMKDRIHARGEATEGGAIGDYRSRQYKAKRIEAGRQVRKKDLVFKGNLIRNYGTGTFQGKQVIGFFQDRYRLIATGQEQQTGKTIFTIRQETIEEGKRQYLRAYNRVLSRKL